MKSIILATALIFGMTASSFAVETKKVCVDQKDAKTGKTKQVCKEVKQHKKLEGTKVPEKK
jgi:hypothetical protein